VKKGVADLRKKMAGFRRGDGARLAGGEGAYMANSVVHFEIFATDVERRARFTSGRSAGGSKLAGRRISTC
jgi:hypothetical protein